MVSAQNPKMGSVKTVVKLRLDPNDAAKDALEATLTLCNTAATEVAATAQHRGVFRNWDLRKITYQRLREKGLSSQTAPARGKEGRRCLHHPRGQRPER